MTHARSSSLVVRVLLALLSLGAMGTAARAQPAALDERQYRAARDLERSGQLEQAEEIYRQIVDSRPDSDRADDALLALARIAWPLDDPGQLAADASALGSIESARSSLELLRKKYAAGDAAAEGLFRLALTHLVPHPRAWRPEEAAALLTTLPVLYPGAPEVPAALALAAELDIAAGRPSRASELAFRLIADWPDSPYTAQAWIVLGRVDFAAGRADEALAAFGAARRSAAERDERVASRALELSTLVDRVAYAPSRPAAAYRFGTVARPLPGKASDLASDGEGRILAVLPRDDALVVVEQDGTTVQKRPSVGAAAVAVDAWGRSWLAHGAGIATPAGDTLPLPPKARLSAIAPVAPGTVWAVDDRERRVVRLELGAGIVAEARLPQRSTPLRVAPAEDGGAWILTERPSLIVGVGPNGLPRKTIRLDSLVREPYDFDRDSLGHLYVLDRRELRVLVLSEEGQVLQRIALSGPDRGIEKPEAIAVDGSGAVAVFDARDKRISWFR